MTRDWDGHVLPAIVLAYAKRPGAMWGAPAAVGLHLASVGRTALLWLLAGGKKDGVTILAVIAFVAAVAIYGFAWRRRGRRRLSLLVDAYLVAGLPLAGGIAATSSQYGGWILGVAFALLGLLRAAQLARLATRFSEARR